MTAHMPCLTRREHEVLGQLLKGLTSDQIARSIGCSPRTVAFHRLNIREKFGGMALITIARYLAHDCNVHAETSQSP